MHRTTLILYVVTLTLADEPIIHLVAQCPSRSNGNPFLRLTADVPAYAVARCRNEDKPLVETDEVTYSLAGSFDQSYVGNHCQFYKKDGSNTYTVDVEVGWGDRDSQVLQQSRTRTLSCAYDDHGQAVSPEQNITDGFLNPWESQTLLGGNSSATFVLKVMDVLGEEVTSDYISLGRKIRLMAEDSSGKAVAFRALSCSALNSVSRYHVLRAGCGDGLVFSKTAGFKTVGKKVYSPFFEAFKLAGADYSVHFQCRFTECSTLCDGDSCSVITNGKRPKRSLGDVLRRTEVVADSKAFRTR